MVAWIKKPGAIGVAPVPTQCNVTLSDVFDFKYFKHYQTSKKFNAMQSRTTAVSRHIIRPSVFAVVP